MLLYDMHTRGAGKFLHAMSVRAYWSARERDVMHEVSLRALFKYSCVMRFEKNADYHSSDFHRNLHEVSIRNTKVQVELGKS